MSQSVFYAVVMGEVTHYYTAFDIVCLIELGVISVEDYCYCFHKEKWNKIKDDEVLIEGLAPQFKEVNHLNFNKKLCPHFTPTPPEENRDKVFSIVEKFTSINKELASDQTLCQQDRKKLSELSHYVGELKARMVTYEKREKKAKRYIRQLMEKNVSIVKEKNEEIRNLIGETFEIENNPEWVMKKEGQILGPFKFSEIYDRYHEGELSAKTLVRRQDEKVFSRISEVYEFNTRLFSQEEMDLNSGKKETHFFVKRANYRVPFYEVGEIRFHGNIYKVRCNNLSSSGCFIEFSQRPEGIEKNSVLQFTMNSQALGLEISSQIIVKNIKFERVVGMGCEFLDLRDEYRMYIEDYVEHYIQSEEKKAS